MAHVRQSGPESGLGIQVKFVTAFQVVLRSEAGPSVSHLICAGWNGRRGGRQGRAESRGAALAAR